MLVPMAAIPNIIINQLAGSGTAGVEETCRDNGPRKSTRPAGPEKIANKLQSAAAKGSELLKSDDVNVFPE